MNEEYFKLFGIKNPYTRFLNGTAFEANVIGWNGIGESFKVDIKTKKPKIIVEIGTFLGHSAIIMGKCRKEVDDNFVLICIDTWLGSIEHWRADACNMLNLFNHFESGTSAMYDQFIKNVIHNGLHNNIIPIPATTKTGYELLKFHGIKPDMIYVDASHAEDDVYMDVKNYSSIAHENTIIFGDDATWPSVQAGLNRVCVETNRTYEMLDGVFWKLK